VDYNEYNNNKWGELLTTGNFETLELLPEITKSDYVNYLPVISDANPNVKNRQFHAVIFTKVEQYSQKQLATLVEKYLNVIVFGINIFLAS
jgi:hypothetical protein